MFEIVKRGRIPNWVAYSILSVVLAIGIAVLCLHGGQPSLPGDDLGSPPPESVLPAGSYASVPLASGHLFPRIEGSGWVNGPPSDPGHGSATLTVVDVWADWCPVCRQTAPLLVEAHQHFAGAGVAFMSLTSLGRSDVESFVNAYAIPWPCGYGATPEEIALLGVYSTERMSRFYHPGLDNYHVGHEITPTLFVVGPNGHILWNDRQARPRHLKDAAGVLQELTEQVEHALAAKLRTE